MSESISSRFDCTLVTETASGCDRLYEMKCALVMCCECFWFCDGDVFHVRVLIGIGHAPDMSCLVCMCWGSFVFWSCLVMHWLYFGHVLSCAGLYVGVMATCWMFLLCVVMWWLHVGRALNVIW